LQSVCLDDHDYKPYKNNFLKRPVTYFLQVILLKQADLNDLIILFFIFTCSLKAMAFYFYFFGKSKPKPDYLPKTKPSLCNLLVLANPTHKF